ncbi:MAG TPA: glutamate formimidoyltransferase [Vicinamibacterales bacterium]|nr:glutamate formimidoyltransferase [Vicinamibacterales bacterium]
MPLIECVPNVSEGRRGDCLDALATAIGTPGVRLLDRSSDPSHNRTVYTFVGEAAPLQKAVLSLFTAAVAAIDLRQHEGVHPRIGAVDVVPFVPLADATMEECVVLARNTAALVADRLGVPMFLYEEAAATDERRSLAEIRRGGLNGIALRMKQPAWRPDFGPDAPHPTAGATAIGARPILIAYNVNLASNRLGVAKRIARTIRASSGGFSHVKAMGVQLERGIVQVSMNLTNYQETSMTTVFDAIAREASVDSVRVLESEIVGLVPAAALPSDPRKRLKLRETDLDRILENRLQRSLE